MGGTCRALPFSRFFCSIVVACAVTLTLLAPSLLGVGSRLALLLVPVYLLVAFVLWISSRQYWAWDDLGLRLHHPFHGRAVAWGELTGLDLMCDSGAPRFQLRAPAWEGLERPFGMSFALLGTDSEPLCAELLRRYRPWGERLAARLAAAGLELPLVGGGTARIDSDGVQAQGHARLDWSAVQTVVVDPAASGGEQLTLRGDGRTLTFAGDLPEYLAVARWVGDHAVNARCYDLPHPRALLWETAVGTTFVRFLPATAPGRPLEPTRRQPEFGLFEAGMLVLYVAMFCLSMASRDHVFARLALHRHPQPATAVVSKLCGAPANHHIHFDFTTPDGRHGDGVRHDPHGDGWAGFAVGTTLPIVYAASDPSVNEAADRHDERWSHTRWQVLSALTGLVLLPVGVPLAVVGWRRRRRSRESRWARFGGS